MPHMSDDYSSANTPTNSTGRGGALGMLASKLEQGLNKKKKQRGIEKMDSNRGFSSQAMGETQRDLKREMK